MIRECTHTIAALSAVLLGACEFDMFGKGYDRTLPEDRGTIVATLSGYGVSYADNGTVAAVDQLHSAIAVRRAGASAFETVHTVPNSSSLGDIWLSPNGAALYFMEFAHQPDAHILKHLTLETGDLVTLTDRAGYSDGKSAGDGHGSELIPSTTGDRAAFTVAPDSLFIFVPATGAATFVGAGCNAPVLFSPAGNSVLCVASADDPPYGRYVTLSLSTAPSAPQPFNLLPDTTPAPMRIAWTQQSAFAIYRHSPNMEVLGPGTVRTAVPILRDHEEVSAVDNAIARDGKQVAFWRFFCARSSGLFSCDQTQYVLYVIAIPGGVERPVAVTSLVPSFTTFSPDGNSILYAAGPLYQITSTLFRVAVH